MEYDVVHMLNIHTKPKRLPIFPGMGFSHLAILLLVNPRAAPGEGRTAKGGAPATRPGRAWVDSTYYARGLNRAIYKWSEKSYDFHRSVEEKTR